MSQNTKPIGRRSDVIIQEFGDEVFIYDLKSNKVYSLNETATGIWRLCDGKLAVSEIAEKVGKDIDPDLVWIAIDQLKKQSLLENADEFEPHFTPKTRREVIKRIGFASMVALPMVASIVAPTSLRAQSGFSCQTCTPDGGTVTGSFPGLNDSSACIANLTNCCCSMMASAGTCSCPTADCTGSITCFACIAAGMTSSGSFPGLNDSSACTTNLTALCCSQMASSGNCSCSPSGDCSGSITCA